jgi:hypothetical protein
MARRANNRGALHLIKNWAESAQPICGLVEMLWSPTEGNGAADIELGSKLYFILHSPVRQGAPRGRRTSSEQQEINGNGHTRNDELAKSFLCFRLDRNECVHKLATEVRRVSSTLLERPGERKGVTRRPLSVGYLTSLLSGCFPDMRASQPQQPLPLPVPVNL